MAICIRCGREAELLASTDGSMMCQDCIIQAKPQCVDCVKCHQRKCGDAIYACPFCYKSTQEDMREYERKVTTHRLEPLRVDERCERCGQTFSGRAFVLNGKALCRDCLVYEQGRWEIVAGKPGKGGSRVRIVIEKPLPPGELKGEAVLEEERLGRKLFHSIGVDPENPPPDPFRKAGTIEEGRMADDSCASCPKDDGGANKGGLVGGHARRRGPPRAGR